ncbi:hypothetical protein [Sphingomonas colocasiae]|uniref:Tail assembly chaperone n=1 Tax=Sphingomonas colocasiae TaxID=1848973 RepID=A0ABS7PSG6_9SPHN|nr:hypothetical protein [Sphingomonas colocasiae]MBY8824289.1 hypothetical protein [Sphingomonas colocasiae]
MTDKSNNADDAQTGTRRAAPVRFPKSQQDTKKPDNRRALAEAAPEVRPKSPAPSVGDGPIASKLKRYEGRTDAAVEGAASGKALAFSKYQPGTDSKQPKSPFKKFRSAAKAKGKNKVAGDYSRTLNIKILTSRDIDWGSVRKSFAQAGVPADAKFIEKEVEKGLIHLLEVGILRDLSGDDGAEMISVFSGIIAAAKKDFDSASNIDPVSKTLLSSSPSPKGYYADNKEQCPDPLEFLEEAYAGRLGIDGDLTLTALARADEELADALKQLAGSDIARLQALLPSPKIRNDAKLMRALGYVPNDPAERQKALTTISRGGRPGSRGPYKKKAP